MGNSKKKSDKRRLRSLERHCVSIQNFLSRILGVKSDELMRANLTHSDLEKLFPNLKKSSFDAILDDPSMIYTGEVVLVQDAAHHIAPYFNTKMKTLDDYGIDDVIDKKEWEQSSETWDKSERKTPNINDYDLSSMSLYELEKLLKIYSKTHQPGNYERVRREIVSRDNSIQGSKQSKQKALKRDNKRNKNNND